MYHARSNLPCSRYTNGSGMKSLFVSMAVCVCWLCSIKFYFLARYLVFMVTLQRRRVVNMERKKKRTCSFGRDVW